MTTDSHLRDMTAQDLTLVLAWRNHPEVRKYMFRQDEIGAGEHREWFRRCLMEPGRHLLVYEEGDGPAGFANLGNAFVGSDATWGFYVAPGAPRGTGGRMCQAALDHAFSALGVRKVSGEAIATNLRSIALHERLGFLREGMRREPRPGAPDGYHEVVCFGLTADAWRIRTSGGG